MLLVDHVNKTSIVKNKDDEESQSSLDWKSCLFKDNPIAQKALNDVETGKKDSPHYHLGKYLQKLKTDG